MQALDIVLFGGTGDLSYRKLLPAFYYMCRDSFLPSDTRIILVARRNVERQQLLGKIETALSKFLAPGDFDADTWSTFKNIIQFKCLDTVQADDWQALSETLEPDNKARDILYYLAVPPTIFGTICEQINHFNLNPEQSRIIVEKPLGEDLTSSQAIEEEISKAFNEHQIYRIDHYLGKNSLQSILPFRLKNETVEKFWSGDYIDNVQITISEAVGVEGRFEFLDRAGVLRDMVQNHLMQILCMVAMELPQTQEADDIRDQKRQVAEALATIGEHNIFKHVVRGQYTAGTSGDDTVPGYIDEIGDAAPGHGETYIAVKTYLETARWLDVPFYLRMGKRLSGRFVDVIVQFKPNVPEELILDENNCLSFNIQPDECVTPDVYQDTYLSKTDGTTRKQEAYEVLLRKAINNDQTYFVRKDEIEASWKWIDSIRSAWTKANLPMQKYAAGSFGPKAANDLLDKDKRIWLEKGEG